MGYPATATGFCVNDIKKWSDFNKQDFKLKPFGDHDVDVAIDACGVCSSDVHRLTGGWGEDFPLPVCVGHEIIGRAVKVGPKCNTGVKVGDRVGVGAQVWADLTCSNCKANQENYCPQQVDTYAATYPDGSIAYGGYASHIRVHEYFVFPIPDKLDTNLAAPMLCAGITVYSPLKRLGCGPGKKVGIVGIGGLGHFGVLFANALGAEVTAISHSPSKKEDTLKLGAQHFIDTSKKSWHEPHAFEFDFVINTADMVHKFNLSEYFSILKVNGTFHNVGMPDNPIEKLMLQEFVSNGCYLGTSHIGNRQEILDMLDLAAKQNIKSWIETIQISEKGCKEAVERVKKSDVRYRFVLTGYDEAFGKRT